MVPAGGPQSGQGGWLSSVEDSENGQGLGAATTHTPVALSAWLRLSLVKERTREHDDLAVGTISSSGRRCVNHRRGGLLTRTSSK